MGTPDKYVGVRSRRWAGDVRGEDDAGGALTASGVREAYRRSIGDIEG